MDEQNQVEGQTSAVEREVMFEIKCSVVVGTVEREVMFEWSIGWVAERISGPIDRAL